MSRTGLKRQFAFDDEALEHVKLELIDVHEIAIDKDKKWCIRAGRLIRRYFPNRTSLFPSQQEAHDRKLSGGEGSVE